MIFSQIEYFWFFGVVFTLYWLVPARARLSVLVPASLLFYGTWNFKYLFLLLGTTGLDYFSAIKLTEAATPRARRLWLTGSLIANLGILSLFKYYGFFVRSLVDLGAALGLSLHPATLDVLLPVGVSFYTFQSMSYTIDVYRGLEKPVRSPLMYLAFVSFFPQLVAGPIVRARHLVHQLERPVTFDVAQFKSGARLFAWGLLKKNLFADLVAVRCVDLIFGHPGDFDVPTLWLAALGYSVQIYADFSGYSDMARGSARMLGYELPVNFETPYRSLHITEFWRRWHMSLSSWLRDYLYISLGGNRKGPRRTWFNLFATMFLGGLWHGASWTFVVWGGLHGAALAVHKIYMDRLGREPAMARLRAFWGYRLACGGLTFLFVCLCFVLFRAPDFGTAARFMAGLAGLTGGAGAQRLLDPGALGAVAIFLCATWLVGGRDFGPLYARVPWPLRAVGYAAATLALLLLTPTTQVPFVYFQF